MHCTVIQHFQKEKDPPAGFNFNTKIRRFRPKNGVQMTWLYVQIQMKDIGGKFFGEKHRVGEKMNSWEMYNDN